MEKQSNVILSIATTKGEYAIVATDLLQHLSQQLGVAVGSPLEVRLQVNDKDGNRLIASTAYNELDYPGIFVDGETKDGIPYYLAQAELSNESYPDSYTARLYAGCADYETGMPIAMVKSRLDDNRPDEPTLGTEDAVRKIVYVDADLAKPVSWVPDISREHFGNF